jgi:hypothetical protein
MELGRRHAIGHVVATGAHESSTLTHDDCVGQPIASLVKISEAIGLER